MTRGGIQGGKSPRGEKVGGKSPGGNGQGGSSLDPKLYICLPLCVQPSIIKLI